jgi:hypothetical protein
MRGLVPAIEPNGRADSEHLGSGLSRRNRADLAGHYQIEIIDLTKNPRLAQDIFRWFAVFKRHFSGRFADRHRRDFGAFETLKSAQQACEDHAQEFRPEHESVRAQR